MDACFHQGTQEVVEGWDGYLAILDSDDTEPKDK